MKKKMNLLPKMAANNIRKNGSTYLPYIGISIFAMFTYFVFDLILKNDIMYTLPKGVYALILVQIRQEEVEKIFAFFFFFFFFFNKVFLGSPG